MKKIREGPDEQPEIIEDWPSQFDEEDMAVIRSGNVVWDGETAYYQEDEEHGKTCAAQCIERTLIP